MINFKETPKGSGSEQMSKGNRERNVESDHIEQKELLKGTDVVVEKIDKHSESPIPVGYITKGRLANDIEEFFSP
ncbi:MAG: hypothetical protein ABEI53_02985 [Candidatus Magasanikbacteria bacterium]